MSRATSRGQDGCNKKIISAWRIRGAPRFGTRYGADGIRVGRRLRGMAAEPTIDRAHVKRLLIVSKKEPVSCAVGFANDPQFGLLELDKIKQPKALERELLKSTPGA